MPSWKRWLQRAHPQSPRVGGVGEQERHEAHGKEDGARERHGVRATDECHDRAGRREGPQEREQRSPHRLKR